MSVLYDRDASAKVPPSEWKSVNLFGVGFGVLRNTTQRGTNSLLLDYGPNRSHGHPDKLNIDLYAFGDRLIPDPGSVWYEDPAYKAWYHTTLAHNTLDVDELEQRPCDATQIVYGPAETLAIQRAWTDQAYAGVSMDRALFFTPDYLADIFGAFAQLPRKMDLAWHIRGQFASDLKMDPIKFAGPLEVGYSELTNLRHATTDQPWSATITGKNGAARFFAAGGTQTEVIVGDGLLNLEKPPTILQRRVAGSTVYGNAVDISGSKDGYVKGVSTEGDLEKGYALLKVQTGRGTDLCFASYRPGSYKIGELTTDAQQAFVLMDGPQVRAMYMGGGKELRVGNISVTRNEPGLACVERTETGAYIVANPSSGDATITLNFAPLAGLDAYQLDANGQRTGPATVSAQDGAQHEHEATLEDRVGAEGRAERL